MSRRMVSHRMTEGTHDLGSLRDEKIHAFQAKLQALLEEAGYGATHDIGEAVHILVSILEARALAEPAVVMPTMSPWASPADPPSETNIYDALLETQTPA